MGARYSEVSGNANNNDLQRSFLTLIQIYSYKAARFLKCIALVAYSVQVVWLNFTGKRKTYFIDHGYILLGFLPAGSAVVGTEDTESVADMDVLHPGLTSL